MNIRTAKASDLETILNIHRTAFKNEAEAIVTLVEDLLQDPSAQPVISLLAEQQHQAVGHVLFSQARVEQIPVILLAPLAVTPNAQGQGVGSALVKAGLQAALNADISLAFVLGYPDYYTRFGFHPAGIRGFDAPYPILERNADAWMVLELKSNGLKGVVQCAKAIDKAEYWQE